jgi:hypothetical protein
MSSSTAVGEQPWMQVLEALYENELVIEANGPNISIHPDAAVFDTTDLSEEEVVSEVEYLLDAELITWIDADEEATEFKQHRLTKEGFQMIHEQKQAERRLEWQRESANINQMLTIATIVLAVTAIFQAVAVLLDIQPPIRWALLGFYTIVLGISTVAAYRILPNLE